MPASYRLAHITLATTNTPAMVAFYNAVFEVNLQPTAAYGTTLYKGTLAGISLLICPNEIAGVQAEQNRHQLQFVVPDLADTLERVHNAGGTVDDTAEARTRASVHDPDGNTIEFVQADLS